MFCSRCGEPIIFDEDGTVHHMTEEETPDTELDSQHVPVRETLTDYDEL